MLKRLLRMVEQLKAQGLAGRHNGLQSRVPERLRAMQKIIDQWSGGGGKPLSPVEAMPEPARSQQLAAESMAVRQSNAQVAQDQKRTLAGLRRSAR